ncbi:hypothetical protein D3C73_1491230 [compost metagenome]
MAEIESIDRQQIIFFRNSQRLTFNFGFSFSGFPDFHRQSELFGNHFVSDLGPERFFPQAESHGEVKGLLRKFR